MSARSLYQPQIGYSAHNSIQYCSIKPEAAIMTAEFNGTSIHAIEAHCNEEVCDSSALKQWKPEQTKTVESSLRPRPVEVWILDRLLLRNSLVKHCIPEDGDSSEEEVIALVQNGFVQGLTTEDWVESKEPLGHDVKEILVEQHVRNDTVPSIVLSSVIE